MDFTKFDKEIDTKQLQKDVNEAVEKGGTGNYTEVPAGEYNCTVDKLELGETKDGRPMVKAQFRIKEGKFKKSCLFVNRVIYGTKNDGNAIESVIGWLKTLEPSDEIEVKFESYSQFAELCMDIDEDICELEYVVSYDPDAYNNVSIKDVLE